MKSIVVLIIIIWVSFLFSSPSHAIINGVEFWDDNGDTTTILHPNATHTIVFAQEDDFIFVDVVLSLNNESYNIHWDGNFTSDFDIIEDITSINTALPNIKIGFFLPQNIVAGFWDVSITTDNEQSFSTIQIDEFLVFEISNILDDMGERNIGTTMTDYVQIEIFANGEWEFIISSTGWSNGSHNLPAFSVDNFDVPHSIFGNGNSVFELSFSLYVDTDSEGRYDHTLSFEINSQVHDVYQWFTVFEEDPPIVLNDTGNIKVSGYMSDDINALGGYIVYIEVANDFHFYDLIYIESVATDSDGYFLLYVTGNFSQWIRSVITVGDRDYYSNAVMIQGLDLEYDLSIHIPKSAKDLTGEFVEDYGAITLGFMGIGTLVFAVARKMLGSPL